MNINLKGEIREFEAPISVLDIAASIGEGLKRACLCGRVNGKLVDASYVISEDSTVEIVTFRDEDGKRVYNHSCAHVLAQAVKRLFPTAKLAIGPAIDNGFYYDFEFKTPVSNDDLERIEKEMHAIVKANIPIEREVVSRQKALTAMTASNEDYKIVLINELPEDAEITFYNQGEYTDLCAGPHICSTGQIKAFKLTGLAGAYWKGSEKNKMLTRIYGTAFDKKADLEAYLTALEEAKKRDHNKIGRDLGLFMTSEVVGQGLPILMPKGAKILQILQRFVEDEEAKRGFMLTKTPNMAKSDLYKISGHWDHYRDKMFVLGDPDKEEEGEEVMALRPMTCPFQYQIYLNGLKSYRDLPARYSETATLFRNEASGEMHGLIRIRQFTLSDGHIICTPSQVADEFKRCLDLSYYILDALGMRDMVTFRFSKWDENDKEKYIDDPEAWEVTQNMMREILNDIGLEYVEADGEAAFYGPKLDVQTKNVHGKEDTLITIQIDFSSAERFGMYYVDENGEKKLPYIIHRSSIGCYERTLAMLIEKYAGAFPLWMSPVQVKVISLTERTAGNAKKFVDELLLHGFRAEYDVRDEKVGKKIREAQLEKIPYMVIIGDKEAEAGLVAVRERSAGDLGQMTPDDFIKLLYKEVNEKVIK